MAVNVEFGVSGVAAFRAGVKEAEQSIKTLDAELKLNEKQLKVNGDAEQYMQNKTKLLEKQIKEQTNVVKQAETALKNMKRTGVDENSAAFQKMQEEVYKAQGKLADMQAELMNVNSSMQQTASGADKLTESVNGINRKISLDQVITGIGSITNGLEKAAKKAVDLGETIWTSIMDSARWADDTATMATIMDMSVEDYQRYKKTFDTIGDITVQEWHKMKRKVEKAIQDPTEDQNQLFSLLGISTHEMHPGKYGPVAGMAKNYEDLFWEVSRELQKRVKNGSMTQASANVYAEALFGKGFDELKTLIDLGEEAFKAAFENQRVNSEEAVKNMAELNDKIITLQGDFQTLKNEVLGDIAPALTKGAELLDSLLGKLMDYLETEEGQKALEDMGKAVEGLFSNLETIDPEKVVEGFAKVFNDIVGGLTWLSEHSGDVIGALEAIIGGWGILRLTGGALDMLKLVEGLNSLRNHGMPQLPGTEPSAPAADAAGAAGTGSVFWTNLFGNLSTKVTSLAALDPTGSLALLPQLILDRTIFGRHLTNGESVGEAAAASGQGILNSAKAGLEDFWKYISTDIPNAVYGLFGTDKDKLTESFSNFFNPGSSGGHGYAEPVEVEISNPMDLLKGMTLEEKQAYVLLHDFGIKPIEDNEHFVVEDVDIEAILNAKDGKEQIEEQVGTVSIPVTFVPAGGGGGGGTPMFVYDHWNGMMNRLGTRGFANGLFDVPWDGFPAILHKHERVVPAREIGSSRNFSSNLYVESMYMNNGTDAAGLAAAMAAEQRRTMNGFGS